MPWVAYYLLLIQTYYCVQLAQRGLKGVSFAMANDVNDYSELSCAREPGESGRLDDCSSENAPAHEQVTASANTAPRENAPAHAVIILRYRATRIFIDGESVRGCTEIERMSRIPGVSPGVKGLILFKGEPVPLVSFFGGSAERSTQERLRQSGKTDDYAVILSIKGATLATRVDEPPTMCTDMGTLENAGGKTCYMRRKHLERLLDFYVAKVNESCRVAEARSHGSEQETNSVVADLCCAV